MSTSLDTPAAQMVLKVGYQGAGFSGFAFQHDQRTVAGELTQALETLLRRPVEITCAGRTDAGVHALAQYVSLPVTAAELDLSERTLQRALTHLVGDEISILAVLAAPPFFSARFDAEWRAYRYRVASGWSRPILAADHAWWVREELDVEAMCASAATLVGEHDFRSFCKASSAQQILAQGRSLSRRILSFEVTRGLEAGEQLIFFDVRGNAFLHSMVRTLVGTLVEVGRGRKPVSWPAEVLAARDRRAAGQCAPAKGLTFAQVCYPEGLLVPWSSAAQVAQVVEQACPLAAVQADPQVAALPDVHTQEFGS